MGNTGQVSLTESMCRQWFYQAALCIQHVSVELTGPNRQQCEHHNVMNLAFGMVGASYLLHNVQQILPGCVQFNFCPVRDSRRVGMGLMRQPQLQGGQAGRICMMHSVKYFWTLLKQNMLSMMGSLVLTKSISTGYREGWWLFAPPYKGHALS
jgi:hypothetical protein